MAESSAEGEKKKTSSGSGKSEFINVLKNTVSVPGVFVEGKRPPNIACNIADGLQCYLRAIPNENQTGAGLMKNIWSETSRAFRDGATCVVIAFDRGATSAKGSTQDQRIKQASGLTAEVELLMAEDGMIDDADGYDGSMYRTPVEKLPINASEEDRKAAEAAYKKALAAKSEYGKQMRARRAWLKRQQYLVKAEKDRDERLSWDSNLSILSLSSQSGVQALVDASSNISGSSSGSHAVDVIDVVADLPLPAQWNVCCSLKRPDITRFVTRYLQHKLPVPAGCRLWIDGHCCSPEQMGHDTSTWHKIPNKQDDTQLMPIMMESAEFPWDDLMKCESPIEALSAYRKRVSKMWGDNINTTTNTLVFDNRLANTLGETDFSIFHYIVCFCNDYARRGNPLGVQRRIEIISKDTDITLYCLWFLFRCKHGFLGEDLQDDPPQLFVSRSYSDANSSYIDINALYNYMRDRMFGGDDRYIVSLASASFMRDSDYTQGYSFLTMFLTLMTYIKHHLEIDHMVYPIKNGVMRGNVQSYRDLLAYCYWEKYRTVAFTPKNVMATRLLGFELDPLVFTPADIVGDKLKTIRSIVNAYLSARYTKAEKEAMNSITVNPRNKEEFMSLCKKLDKLVPDDNIVQIRALQWFFYVNMADQVGAPHQMELPKMEFGYQMKDPELGDVSGNVEMIHTTARDVRKSHWIQCFKRQ